MIYDDKFEKIYNKILEEKTEYMESLRKEAVNESKDNKMKKFRMLGILSPIIIVMSLFFTILYSGKDIGHVMIVAAIGTLISLLIFGFVLLSLKSKNKYKIVITSLFLYLLPVILIVSMIYLVNYIKSIDYRINILPYFSTTFIYFIFLLIFTFAFLFIFGKKYNMYNKKNNKSKYENALKNIIFNNIFKLYNDTIEYNPNQGIDYSIYKESNFGKFDTYNSKDLVKGKLLDKYNFLMSHIITKVIHKSSHNTYYEILFDGIFAKVELNKFFNTFVYLSKDTDNLKFYFSNIDKYRVQLDSQEFEKFFDVYSSDKIIAMQLLTSDIMQLLVNFKEELNMDYEIMINNTGIYLRFGCSDLFENINLTDFSLDKNNVYKYYRIFNLIFDLSQKIINLMNDTQY